MTRELTGRKFLLILVASFGVVFAVNGYFIFEALHTFRGGESQHPYLQGLEYNQTLKRNAEQAALAWRATIAANRDNAGTVDVTITVAHKDGAPLSGLALQGELRHPADANRDQALQFAAATPGTYIARAAHVSPGAWDVIVQSRDGQEPFEASRRIWLP